MSIFSRLLEGYHQDPTHRRWLFIPYDQLSDDFGRLSREHPSDRRRPSRLRQQDCPITNLYWAFLDRHSDALDDNPRMRLILASLGKRDRKRIDQDRVVFAWVSQTLAEGARLLPEDRPEVDRA